MNLRDLTYLLAVAEQQHFGKAAKACFVSQPTLSMQLKKLEQELGVSLFERTNKSVMITDIGKTVVEHAQSVLLSVKELKEAAASARDPFAGKFKLGAFPTLAPYLFPQVMGQFNSQLSKLQIYLIEEKTEHLISLLVSGQLDAAILALPVDDDKLHCEHLFFEPFYLACSKQCSLAQNSGASHQDLLEYPVMLLEEGHCLRDQALDVCFQANLKDFADFSASSLETLRVMVAMDMGITLMPALSVIAESLSVSALKFLPFSDRVPKREIALCWRKQSSRQECSLTMATLIKHQIQELFQSLLKYTPLTE